MTHTASANELTPAEQRVAGTLEALGLPGRVVVLEELATTAPMAAVALGVEVGQIVKSLCFMGAESQEAVFVLVSGANRVHEKRVGRLVGEKLARADADFVKAATGFSIGGVSPFGHPAPLRTWIDEDLLHYETVWAAAGNPRSVFEIAPADLARTTGATAIRVT